MGSDMEDNAPDVRHQLDHWMRRMSFVVSVCAVLAMILGLVDIVATGAQDQFAKAAAIPTSSLWHPAGHPFGIYAMSLGIVLLSLLPGLRVLLAGVLYASRRDLTDAAVALLVLVELLVSMLTGRG